MIVLATRSSRLSAALRGLPWLLAIAGIALDLAAFWPGQMSFDSAYAWWQARGGETTDIVSPTMVLLWRFGDSWIAGPATVFALHIALFWCGLALIAVALRLRPLHSALLMIVVAFAPVPWLLRGHVWTDVGLFCTLTFATGALAMASVSRTRTWLIVALPCLFYAMALRHNAFPALLPFIVAWCWLWLRCAPENREHDARSQRGRWIALTIAIGAALVLGVAAVDRSVDRRVPLWTSLAEWDLAALSIAHGEMLLPSFMIGPGLDVGELGTAFRSWSNTPMLQTTQHGMRDPFASDYTQDQLAELRHAWIEAILAHPDDWIAHRWRLAVALFGTHEPDWPRELIFVDDEFQYRDSPPIARNASALHRNLMRFASTCAATPVLAAWPYALIGAIAIFRIVRYRNRAAWIASMLLSSAWLYSLTLLAFAPSAELRYLGWTSVASLLAAALSLTKRTDRTDC